MLLFFACTSIKCMQRNAQQPMALCYLLQRGDDLYHSSHSFPSDNPQGESDGGLLNKIRKGRDESSRMHTGVRGEYERGELRWKGRSEVS